MTDEATMHARDRPQGEPMRLVLQVGANRLEITAGPSDVVLDVVRLWLGAIGGGDSSALLAAAEQATSGIDANNKTLSDAQTDTGKAK